MQVRLRKPSLEGLLGSRSCSSFKGPIKERRSTSKKPPQEATVGMTTHFDSTPRFRRRFACFFVHVPASPSTTVYHDVNVDPHLRQARLNELQSLGW
ncbi:hypothetical protein CC2G_011636 [Coprinopsis cinerea AmutBmut pab1-1]|nr:hypothetical protein CC2G_011636 [Coprinopsis cinerea AmutBmut pab1-1]